MRTVDPEVEGRASAVDEEEDGISAASPPP